MTPIKVWKAYMCVNTLADRPNSQITNKLLPRCRILLHFMSWEKLCTFCRQFFLFSLLRMRRHISRCSSVWHLFFFCFQRDTKCVLNDTPSNDRSLPACSHLIWLSVKVSGVFIPAKCAWINELRIYEMVLRNCCNSNVITIYSCSRWSQTPKVETNNFFSPPLASLWGLRPSFVESNFGASSM